jgi:peroxiredoxin Q/BCP
MLKVGDTAPDFSLPDQDGRPQTLDALLAGGPLILFFYPADFSPVCTRQACEFRDGYADLAAAGISVAGVSPNSHASHRRFDDRHKLGYPLLADPDKAVIKAFGIDGPLGIGMRRATFLIGSDRTIQAAVRADFRLGPHRELIRQAKAETKKGSKPFSGGKGL